MKAPLQDDVVNPSPEAWGDSSFWSLGPIIVIAYFE